MPSIICRSTAGSLRPLPAICSASKIAGYKNVRFVPRSTCGFTAAKIKDTEYKTVSAAIAAANTDDVIVLESDANEVSTTVPEGKTVTIDLNGKSYSISEWFSIYGDLTLTNSAETAASVNIAFVHYNTFRSS